MPGGIIGKVYDSSPTRIGSINPFNSLSLGFGVEQAALIPAPQ